MWHSGKGEIGKINKSTVAEGAERNRQSKEDTECRENMSH